MTCYVSSGTLKLTKLKLKTPHPPLNECLVTAYGNEMTLISGSKKNISFSQNKLEFKEQALPTTPLHARMTGNKVNNKLILMNKQQSYRHRFQKHLGDKYVCNIKLVNARSNHNRTKFSQQRNKTMPVLTAQKRVTLICSASYCITISFWIHYDEQIFYYNEYNRRLNYISRSAPHKAHAHNTHKTIQ